MLFAYGDVEPRRRAVGAVGEATAGKESLDGDAGDSQILQW